MTLNQSEYDVAVNKSVSSGTPLLTVSAVDADAEGKNSRLSYHLEDKFSRHFSLDRYTGTLRTNRDLDCDEDEQEGCPGCLGTQKSSCSILVTIHFFVISVGKVGPILPTFNSDLRQRWRTASAERLHRRQSAGARGQ